MIPCASCKGTHPFGMCPVTSAGLDLFGRVSTQQDPAARSPFDFYETARWQTMALLRHHPTLAGLTVFEPCSGRDAITDVLRRAGCAVYTNDLDARQPAETHGDATAQPIWEVAAARTPRFEAVVTNVPFALAFPILVWAVQYAPLVALLCRKTFTEPTDDRGPWLAAHPPTRQICLPRHSFRGEGSDSTSADWFLWEREPDRSLPPIVVDHLAEIYR